MKTEYKFYISTETHVGIGLHRTLASVIRQKGFSRILALLDENIQSIDPVQTLLRDLEVQKAHVTRFLIRGSEEPDYDYLDTVADAVRASSPDLVLAVGGGSTLDLGKAVAVLLTNPGKGLQYRGFDQVKNPGIPLMAIPTTAGTGSEITINAVFTNKAENKKLGINGRYMNATYAVLDPEFTASAPPRVAVSAGIDAMVHTLESFVGTNANPMTRMYARQAFSLLYHNLGAIVDDPSNLEKRLNIQMGAYFAAISLFNSSSGIAGGLSYPLGVYYKVPHGIGGGMFAVPVVDYNVQNGYFEYNELYDLIENADRSLSPAQKCQEFVRLMTALVRHLSVPQKLSIFGIGPEQKEHVISIMQGLQGAFDQNPVKLRVEEVGKLLDPFF